MLDFNRRHKVNIVNIVNDLIEFMTKLLLT